MNIEPRLSAPRFLRVAAAAVVTGFLALNVPAAHAGVQHYTASCVPGTTHMQLTATNVSAMPYKLATQETDTSSHCSLVRALVNGTATTVPVSAAAANVQAGLYLTAAQLNGSQTTSGLCNAAEVPDTVNTTSGGFDIEPQDLSGVQLTTTVEGYARQLVIRMTNGLPTAANPYYEVDVTLVLPPGGTGDIQAGCAVGTTWTVAALQITDPAGDAPAL